VFVRSRLIISLRRLSIQGVDTSSMDGYKRLSLLLSLTHLTLSLEQPDNPDRRPRWNCLPTTLSPALEHLTLHLRPTWNLLNLGVSVLLQRLRAIQDRSGFNLRSLHIAFPGSQDHPSEDARNALAHVIAVNAPSLEECLLLIPDALRPYPELGRALLQCRRLRTLDFSHDMMSADPLPVPPPVRLPALRHLRVSFHGVPNRFRVEPPPKDDFWRAMGNGVFPGLTRLELIGLDISKEGASSQHVVVGLGRIAPTLRSLRFRQLTVSQGVPARLGAAIAGMGNLSSLTLHFSSRNRLLGVGSGIDSLSATVPLRVLEVGDMPLNDLVAFLEEPPRGLVRATVEVLRLGVDKRGGSLPHGRLEPRAPPSPASAGGVEGGDPSHEREGGEEDGEEEQARVLDGGKARVEDVVMAWLTSPPIKPIRSVEFHDLSEREVGGSRGQAQGVSPAERVLDGVNKLDSRLHLR
jgi:hypothetical protein